MIKLSIKTKFMRAATMLLLMLFTTATAWAQETTMTVTAENVTVTYDGSEHYITVNVSVPESGATITYCETENGTYTSTNPTYTNAGVNTVYYKVTASGYADCSGSATVTINRATPSSNIPPTASAISYGERLANSTLSGHPIGVNGAELSGTWAWVAPTTMPNVSDSGTTEYSVIFTPTDYTNYDSFTTTTTLTINKAPLTITANSKSINYGDEPANNGVRYSGFVEGEDESNLYGTLTYAYSYSQYGDVGNAYTITPSGLTSGNYEISFVDGTLTVIAKALTVAADDITIDHGAAAPAYTYSVTGLVNGELLTTEPTLSSTYTQGAAIGTYPISISGAAASANYTISYAPGTLTVQSKKYTVTFVDEDGTTVLKEGEEYEYGTAAADIVKPADPTKAATAQYTYTFAGWDPEIAMVTGDATYTATYSSTAVSYNINYVLYGGTNNPSNPTTYTCESAITLGEPTAPENSGYTFGGWYTDANFENRVGDTAIPQGTTGEMTFYAEWKTTLTATAVWADDNNKYGVRPETVTVTLSDGTNETSYPLDNNSNPLTCTVYDLQKYKNGTEIVYTWTITGALDCYEQSKNVDGNTTTFDMRLMDHGNCGQTGSETAVSWDYDFSTKTITISGGGPMMYYNSVLNGDQSYSNGAPWRAFAGEIEHVIIENGITYVGSNTFAHCPKISSVTLPTDQQLYEIGPGAFGDCTSLTSIDIPMSVNKINDGAFAGCSNLASVTLGYGDGAKFTIGTEVFPATTTIIVPAVALQSYLQASSWCAYADKIITTGYCGKDNTETTDVDESHNVIWTLAKNTGDKIEGNEPLTLTISKNPEVTAAGADFSMADDYPFNDGVSGISEYEYKTSMSITQAVIGDGVTSIGENAFLNCENLATVSIPSSVTSIGTGAFIECKSLTSNITIPDGVTVINNSTFNGCEKLTTVVLPSGLTTIGAGAFAGCDKLSSIGVAGSTTNALPTSLTAIGTSAFTSSSLPAITLNEGLKTIGGDAFSYTNLTTINIPASVENIVEGAFTCNYLESISVADGNTHFITDGKTLIALIDDNNKTLLTYARANTETTSYAVPDGVTRIGAGAFSDSHNLTEVTLPEGLKTIGDNAFYDCDAITDIAIPATVESIGEWCFGRCYKLATIRVFRGTANGITAIGKDAFYLGDDTSVASSRRIYVPDSSLGTYRTADNWKKYATSNLNWIFAAPWGDALRGGFCGVDDATTTTVDESKNVAWALTANGDDPEGCDTGSGLTLTISKNPEVTAEGADFSMADGWPFDDGDGGIDEVTTALSITQAVIGEGVTSIGARAFQNCENMATVSIPSTVTSIGVGAFFSCKSLTSDITIPDGVTVINNSTFNGCAKLTTVVLPSGLTTIGASAFAACDKLSSIGVAGSTTNALPTSLTAIGTSAFTSSSLPAITLNNGLETIDDGAFSYTNLTTINIPASVENIGEGAFTCNYLESISVADGNTHFTTDGDKALIALIDNENKTLLTYARANTAMSYAVPDGVTRIGADAFSDSDHLTEVILPEGLVTIGNRAFFACDELIDIAIPATVESIGTEGFDSCDKLATIRVFRGDANGITAIGKNAFDLGDYTSVASSRRIYVPLSALNTYRTAVNWEKYYSGGVYWIFAGDETELFSSTATNAWMTWCSNKAYGKPVGCKAYTVSAVSGGEVTLTPVAGLLLPAYTPLLIKRDDTSAPLTAIGGAAVTEPASGYDTSTGLVTQSESNFNMLGNATDATITEGGFTEQPFYSLYNGKFYRYEGTQAIAAHRCILTVSPVYTAPVLTIGTETTSVVSIDNGQLIIDNDVWYTLDGRKLDKQPTKKGIYINGGRKVVIK